MIPARTKALIKRRVLSARSVGGVLRAFHYDATRYLSFSSTRDPYHAQENLAAKITERYHNIEKGLSLPSPRPGFGRESVETLIGLVERYIARYGEDHTSRAAIGVLRAYDTFNAGQSNDRPHRAKISDLVGRYATLSEAQCGVVEMSRSRVQEATSSVGLEFFSTRRSTRIFAQRPVGVDDIMFAVAAAATAPAVCNRQFGKVRYWLDRPTVQNLLAVQGGARGFADNVPAIALITSSLRTYWGPGERNQAWVDGGLFSMNFLLGLHARGLGAVPLNWSKTPDRDRRLREVLPELPDHEVVIMLVAFGPLLDTYRVAASPRMQP